MEVKLADLGEGSDKGAKVSFWYFDEGERVEEGEDLVEMVTDKATFNVPVPINGVLKKIVVEEEDIAFSGDVLAVIEEE